MTLLTLAQATTDTATNDVFFIWGCVLFGVAFFLMFLELFIPSGGLIGILAGVAAVASVVAFFRYDATWGYGVMLAYLILGPILIVFVFRVWVNSSLAKMMILGGEERAAEDATEAVMLSETERRKRLAELKALIGVTGVTETALRPVGTVRIEGQRVDALAETGIIEANTPVIVTDVYDNQIKVRPA